MYKILFLTGGFLYCIIEMLYRGHSHYSMVILGGLCFIIIGKLNEDFLEWDTPLLVQGVLGSIIITTLEFVTGIIVNLHFGLNVWDYSSRAFNVLGQICPLYSFLWIIASIVAIILDDFVRYKFFGREKPKYKII